MIFRDVPTSVRFDPVDLVAGEGVERLLPASVEEADRAEA
jgi:hypothetical protein